MTNACGPLARNLLPQLAVALVDCNNFYCSCERVFDPRLATVPVAVLSNNDGCVIARSQEVKDLGVAMGTPAFQVRQQLAKHGVKVLSSNYTLYADMSRRVMEVMESMAPAVEIYSIDEAFVDLSRIPAGELDAFARELQAKVLRWTGIPVGIGIGTTKTLAKVANHYAKKHRADTGGVYSMIDDPGAEASCDGAKSATYGVSGGRMVHGSLVLAFDLLRICVTVNLVTSAAR